MGKYTVFGLFFCLVATGVQSAEPIDIGAPPKPVLIEEQPAPMPPSPLPMPVLVDENPPVDQAPPKSVQPPRMGSGADVVTVDNPAAEASESSDKTHAPQLPIPQLIESPQLAKPSEPAPSNGEETVDQPNSEPSDIAVPTRDSL